MENFPADVVAGADFDWADFAALDDADWTNFDTAFDLTGHSSWDVAATNQPPYLSTDGDFPARAQHLRPPAVQGRYATKGRSSLACVACRSRHSKCDARRPTCSQCRELGRTCSYTQSRRGRKAPTARGVFTQPPEAPQMSLPVAGHVCEDRVLPAEELTTETVGEKWPSSSATQPLFLGKYFKHFHPAHPFVLPPAEFYRRMNGLKPELHTLVSTMDYVGSLFAPSPSDQELRRTRAENTLRPEFAPRNGFTVQALLMFAIAMQAHQKYGSAKSTLDRAVGLAIELRMFSASYEEEHLQLDRVPVLTESWRRTWWYLFVTDAIFAAIRYSPRFPSYDIECDVGLPCEESEYDQCSIPTSRTLLEYRNREFLSGKAATFSSFAYLVDLAYLLGSILGLCLDVRAALEPEILDTEARLMNWLTYLPESKRLLVSDTAGTSDEVIFLAHIVYYT